MDKAIIYCNDCGKETTVKFTYVSEVYSLDCPKCKSKNSYIKDFIWEYPDNTIIKLGNGGCGSVWR